MKQENDIRLKRGWTTGACATAATKAGLYALWSGEKLDVVSITLPKGEQPLFRISFFEQKIDRVEVGIIKDAGDDPDVTHGAMIIACLRQGLPQSGVTFTRGDGIGLITKPGLPIAVGEPAINPVPRHMMTEVIHQWAAALDGPRDIIIDISVPAGAQIALKTWNPRLGIDGGLSILGTTGVVRPFSCSAWIASIHRGIDVARANGLVHVSGSTGSTSEKAVIARYDLPEIALMDMGDFVGGMLKYMRRNPVANLTIAGGFAKMVKLGQGAIDLHSARSQVDFVALADLAAPCGYDHDMVANANSVLDVIQRGAPEMRVKLANAIAAAAQKTALGVLVGAAVNIEILVVARDGQILGTAGTIAP